MPRSSARRKGDELQVEIRPDPLAHVQQRLDREQARIADIDVRADREQPLRDRPVAIGERALDQRILGQVWLQLRPERDAFEQRAAAVDPRHAVGERRVHMKMRIDERRRQQLPGGVERTAGGRIDRRCDLDDPAAAHRDVDAGAAVRKPRVPDQQVEDHDGGSWTLPVP
jgi:hypothetical protein